jgi:hypothetical protein
MTQEVEIKEVKEEEFVKEWKKMDECNWLISNYEEFKSQNKKNFDKLMSVQTNNKTYPTITIHNKFLNKLIPMLII